MSKEVSNLSAKAFYPYYLGEHQNIMCRRLHFVGSAWGLYCLQKVVRTRKLHYIPLGLVGGYGCAWAGHFFFEKNKPATFDYPVQSFIGDWMMFKDILAGNISLTHPSKDKIAYKDIAQLAQDES